MCVLVIVIIIIPGGDGSRRRKKKVNCFLRSPMYNLLGWKVHLLCSTIEELVSEATTEGLKLHYKDPPVMIILGPGTHRRRESLVMLSKPISLQTHSSHILKNFELLSFHTLALTFLTFSLPTMRSMYLHTLSTSPLIIAIH